LSQAERLGTEEKPKSDYWRETDMIENNPSNVSSAFEMLLEEVEAEIDFVNGVGPRDSKDATTKRRGRRWSGPAC
jgi:hypothetical protein